MTEDEFAVYQSLGEETEDHRWAFGTGFTDPLEGIDASVPDGVDAAALAAYCLGLGDDALVYSHRLQQWMTRLPELEEETALANIALDLLGEATWRSCVTSTSSATSGWPSTPTPTSPSWSAGCWSFRPGGSPCSGDWPSRPIRSSLRSPPRASTN